jgi:flagellar motor switch protein FliM
MSVPEHQLSPEQLSAIAAAGRDGAPEPDRRRRGGRVRPIDFSRPTKFLQEQQRKFLRAHETACRTTATRLSAELRTPVEMEVLATDQMAWSSALAEIPQPSVLGIVEVHPIGSRLLLTAQFDALLRMVDRLVGGAGTASTDERMLTEIEQQLTRRLFEGILEQFTPVWEELLGLRLALLELETKPTNVQIAPPSEPTLTLSIELRMDNTSSTLSIVVPYRSIEPVVDRLDRTFADGFAGNTAEHELRLALADVPVEVRAEVGAVDLSLAQVLALRPGHVVHLHAAVDTGVTLYADDVAVQRARPGRDGGQRAVEIVERLERA